MNLIIIAALAAATVADKLDRGYLPPPSAKTAGGSPGSLQTPFASNSFNNGLGGLPKGSYTNEFQGVVVDAVAPGTRAAGPEETGLGAPRLSYGSTNSKVGAAAFKTNPSAFGQASEAEVQTGAVEQGFFNQPGSVAPERLRAAVDRAANTLKFDSEVGPESYSYSFETDNGIVAEENAVATNGVQAQGGYSYTGDDGQVYTVTYTADEGGYQPRGDHLPTPPPIPEEILRSIEQNARDEAAGIVDDGSYDAQKYNTGGDYADNGDTNGKYSHQSSKFGGAGETDVTASGSFISQNNQAGRPGQSSQSAQTLGSGNQIDNSQGNVANKQGNNGFVGQFGSSQSGQAFGSGNQIDYSQGNSANKQGNNRFVGQFGSSQSGQAFGSGNQIDNSQGNSANKQGNNGFVGSFGSTQSGQAFESGNQIDNSQGNSANKQGNNGFVGQFGSSQSGQAFGNSNKGLTDSNTHSGLSQGNNGFSGHFGSSRPGHLSSPSGSSQNIEEASESSTIPDSTGAVAFGQAGHSSSRPSGSSGFPSQGQTGLSSNRPGQTSQLTSNLNQGNRFGNRNEYLPPVNSFGQNRPQNRRPGFQGASQPSQDSNLQTGTALPPENAPQGPDSDPSSVGKPNANGFSGQFGLRPNQGSVQNQPSNNAQLTSNGASFGQSQRFQNRFSSKNEYLPPSNNFGTNTISPQNLPQKNSQFNQQYNANSQFSENLPSSQNQQQESFSNSASSSATTKQPSFGSTSQFRPQSNARPSYQNNNRFPSSQSSTQSQFTGPTPGIQSGYQESQSGSFINQFNAQKATSQPDIELTTPLESSGPQNTADVTSISSFNARPSQTTFETSASSSTASFPSFGSESTPAPQKLGSRPFGSRPSQPTPFPSQPFSSQYQQSQTNSQFSATSSFSQDNDVQGAPSTPSPTFSQQSQGPDDSYYYRQPSKPFGPSQGSRFPSAPSNQFNRAPQRPQNNQFVSQSQANFPTQTTQFQGSSKYPMPPSIAPTVPSQNQFQSSSLSAQYNGITQASISPFSSQAPTQSTQFTQQGQFGRPNNQPSKPFGRIPSRPSFGQSSMSQASFSQTTATPFIQKPDSRQPTLQTQQSFTNQPESAEIASETPSQQYNGELYEYNKPPEVKHAPENNEPSGTATFGQNEQNKFGVQSSRPQTGQKNDNIQTSTAQFNQAAPSSRPFGSPSKPQFGQKIQQTGFGYQTSAQGSSQPQFGQTFASASTQDLSDSQDSPAESQPLDSDVQKQSSSCCQGSQQSSSLPSSLRPLQGVRSQAQTQFGQSSFQGSQGFRPEASVSSFAGKGEQFGGPRKPPSFDENTGYHY